ncbi:MAG: DUF885 domain-containing protein [Candidatus Sulfotelmatobacter sp.]
MRPISLSAVIFLALTTVSHAHSQNSSASSSSSNIEKHQRLLQLFDEEWQYELRTAPEFATSLGDRRYNDRFSDQSPEAISADLAQNRAFLAKFEAFNPSGLSSQDALSLSLMLRKLRQEIEGAQFKPREMPVNQYSGPHTELIELVSVTPFDDVHDYENYISRLHKVPQAFDEVIANMRQGMHDHLMPPRFLLEKAAAQAEEIAHTKAEAGPFTKPTEKFPAAISSAEQTRLRTGVLEAVNHDVIPAYHKLADFLRDEYAPQGRTDPGIWALPDGDARYRFAVREMTTTDLTPDQIHALGLKQIDETETEMLALAHQLGYSDIASLNDHIKKDRQLYATSGQQLLDLYSKYAQQMERQLPKLFGRLPRNKLIVVPMDPFRAKNSVPADYTPGAPDASRPGRINVNEYDPEHRLLLNVEAIAYHEGVPGHHLQFSIAQELPGLPPFRRHGEYTAYTEGWALYSERLGKEIGFYQGPYSDYGRLENEMWRAIRLVVDTGVHSKHWTRDQMVEYFHRYTAMDEPNVQTEVDRYIAWPAQALAYKLGQLEILKLREGAKTRLGSNFDLRAFHDEIVGNGPLPLDVLDHQVEAWIAAKEK